jgi:hypothetical protein
MVKLERAPTATGTLTGRIFCGFHQENQNADAQHRKTVAPEGVATSNELRIKMLSLVPPALDTQLAAASHAGQAPSVTLALATQLAPGLPGGATTVETGLASIQQFEIDIFGPQGPGDVRPPLTARPLRRCLAPFVGRSLTSPVPLPCRRAGVACGAQACERAAVGASSRSAVAP